jgi:hypothetical protein
MNPVCDTAALAERKRSPGERVQSAGIADHILIVHELRPAGRSRAIAGVTPEAAGVYLFFTKGVPNVVRRTRLVAAGAWGDCSEVSCGRPRLVVLVDNSSLDSAADFNLAHIRIGAARGVCEVARATLEYHQAEHGC